MNRAQGGRSAAPAKSEADSTLRLRREVHGLEEGLEAGVGAEGVDR